MSLLNKKYLKALSLELFYNSDDQSIGSFKIYIQNVQNYVKDIIVLVYGKGNISPAQYPQHTYEAIINVLKDFNIDINNAEVYVDLLEYVGIKDNRIYKWESSNGVYFDKVEQINSLDNKVLNDFFYNYYIDKWSTLINSTLNQKEKMDIVARVFAESFLDDYLIQELTSKFHNKLVEVSNIDSNLIDYFTGPFKH